MIDILDSWIQYYLLTMFIIVQIEDTVFTTAVILNKICFPSRFPSCNICSKPHTSTADSSVDTYHPRTVHDLYIGILEQDSPFRNDFFPA